MTTETKHTPGPWTIEYKPGYATRGNSHAVINAERYPAAFVPAWNDPEPGEVFAADEAIANARLIAAAPDLLEALDEMVRWNVKRGGPDDQPLPADQQDPEVAKAMAAIAKAVSP